MSWFDLERLVEDAESDPALSRALGRCRSQREFLLACSRLGYGIDRDDLALARRLDSSASPARAIPADPQGVVPAPPRTAPEWPLPLGA